MTLFDDLLAIAILGFVGLWIYSKISGRSITEIIKSTVEYIKK